MLLSRNPIAMLPPLGEKARHEMSLRCLRTLPFDNTDELSHKAEVTSEADVAAIEWLGEEATRVLFSCDNVPEHSSDVGSVCVTCPVVASAMYAWASDAPTRTRFEPDSHTKDVGRDNVAGEKGGNEELGIGIDSEDGIEIDFDSHLDLKDKSKLGARSMRTCPEREFS